MNKTQDSSNTSKALVVLVTIAVFIIAYLLISLNKYSNGSSGNSLSAVTNSNGVQYIDINAKGGYSPNLVSAKANTKTILRVKTSGTFDCSAALVIPKIKYRNMLPPNGVTEIEIPAQAQNTELNGTCSMGMYKFKIKFN